MNPKKIIGMILVVCLILFGFYLYKLHALAVEDNSIFSYRCVHVNPILIAYKKAFLGYADYLNTYPNPKYTEQDVKGFIDAYESGVRKYVPAEDAWLAMDDKLINRWDFQLIEPWYIKQAAKYQHEMYAAYRTDALNIVGILDHPEAAKNLGPGSPTPARDHLESAMTTYFDFSEKSGAINDWRKYFGRVPIPNGCTEENVTIPNTGGAIHLEDSTPSATPSSVPIDLDGAS